MLLRIVAAIALRAGVDRLLALRFVGNDGAEDQAGDNAGSHRAAVAMAAATAAVVAAAVPMVLHLHERRIAVGLRRKMLRHGASRAARQSLALATKQTPSQHSSSV